LLDYYGIFGCSGEKYSVRPIYVSGILVVSVAHISDRFHNLNKQFGALSWDVETLKIK
jgi:hypothetical protein